MHQTPIERDPLQSFTSELLSKPFRCNDAYSMKETTLLIELKKSFPSARFFCRSQGDLHLDSMSHSRSQANSFVELQDGKVGQVHCFFDDEEVKFAFEVFEIVDLVINSDDTVYAEQASKLEPLAYIAEKTSRPKKKKVDSKKFKLIPFVSKDLIYFIKMMSHFEHDWSISSFRNWVFFFVFWYKHYNSAQNERQ